MAVADYRDLIVWQKGLDLVELVYRVTQCFPREEVYGLTSQLRRAAVSVQASIAEGQGRSTTAEFLHFLSIAHGSLKEVETHAFIPARLGYITERTQSELLNLTTQVGRLCSGLRKSLSHKKT